MPHIVLTAEQIRVLEQTTLEVELRDEQGRILGYIPAPTEEQIIEYIKRNRSNIPPSPSIEVQARLRKLEEIRKRDELDEDQMKDLLRQMRAGEVVGTPGQSNGDR